MEKCRSAILNVVRGDLNYDEHLINLILEEEERKRRPRSLQPPPDSRKKKEPKKPVIKRCDLTNWRKPGRKGYLGKFEQDLAFLEMFVEFQKNQDTYSEYTVTLNETRRSILGRYHIHKMSLI